MPIDDPYVALRSGLIWGRWKSGERLVPRILKEEFGCTSSALREAMLRLAGEGLVVEEKNQGFRAVIHSHETFRQSARLRLLLECEAVEHALSNSDLDWELRLSAAFQKLFHIEKRIIETNDVEKYARHWALHDWEFHSTFFEVPGSELLLRTYRTVFDTYRMYAVAQFRDHGFAGEITAGEHLAIYNAAVERDTSACLDALQYHLTVFDDANRSSKLLPRRAQVIRLWSEKEDDPKMRTTSPTELDASFSDKGSE